MRIQPGKEDKFNEILNSKNNPILSVAMLNVVSICDPIEPYIIRLIDFQTSKLKNSSMESLKEFNCEVLKPLGNNIQGIKDEFLQGLTLFGFSYFWAMSPIITSCMNNMENTLPSTILNDLIQNIMKGYNS